MTAPVARVELVEAAAAAVGRLRAYYPAMRWPECADAWTLEIERALGRGTFALEDLDAAVDRLKEERLDHPLTLADVISRSKEAASRRIRSGGTSPVRPAPANDPELARIWTDLTFNWGPEFKAATGRPPSTEEYEAECRRRRGGA